ncbi:MAG: hypothetical protein HY075_00235 [Deltaproteobacteria bacterium]|nr:hypothetical protein [Deltaproteobacteria bacterium]
MKTVKAEPPSRDARAQPSCATTMIGSVPHHNIDAALAFAFQVDVPFLPQIPMRNPWEFMIAQALEGLPGLTAEKDGAVQLDIDVWAGRSHALNERLLSAFSAMGARQDAFASFEPSAATSSSWQPFLWDLEEGGHRIAKIQIAGPLTAQWVLRLSDGSSIAKHGDVSSQIYRLVLARALAMARRLQSGGIQPILFLDEPGLYGFMASDPRHMLALQELRIVVQALRKENVLVGLHCCSNTDWSAVLGLGLSFVSLDVELSLDSILQQHADALEKFLRDGGRLSLGVVPTAKQGDHATIDPGALFERLLDKLGKAPLSRDPKLVRETLRNALFTPACGLALNTAAEAEAVLATLGEFSRLARRNLD